MKKTELLWYLSGLFLIGVIVLQFLRFTKESFVNQSGIKHIRHFYPKQTKTGMGDFIRGSFVLAVFCKKNGYTYDIDYSQHEIHKYMENKHFRPDIPTPSDRLPALDILKSKDLYLKLEDYIQKMNADVICVETSNAYIEYPIDEDVRRFLRESFLPKEEIKQEVRELQAKLGVGDISYGAIHARMGDDALSGKHQQEQYASIKNEIQKQLQKVNPVLPMLMLSDDIKFKEFMKSDRITPVPTKPAHTGLSNELKDTMVDFFMLCGAKAIVQHSNYWWGSGFSDRAADMYNIPTYKTKKPEYR